MKRHNRRRLPWVLMALGAVMALAAALMLAQTRPVLQYALLAPTAGENGENIRTLSDSAVKLGSDMKDILSWTTISGTAGKVSLSAGSVSCDAELWGIGEGFTEVYPRTVLQGRRISESELSRGDRVMVLDEGLAFRLFGEKLPEDAKVKLNNVEYRVVGTVRHSGSVFGGRGVGDRVEYDACMPLITAAADGVTLNTLTLSALPKGGSGASTLFEQSAKQWQAGGRLIDLDKEAMRRRILPGAVLLIVGLYALLGLFLRATDLVMGAFDAYRQALKQHYFRQLIPRLLGTVGLTLLVYGALIAAAYGLLVWASRPLYVFTEWVPDNIVEWSSLEKVFWNLITEAAEPVRVATRELRVVQFWGGVLRWGTVLVLLGAALLPKRSLRQDEA